MNRDEWIKIAERCERAKGPDREIDQDVALLLGWTFQEIGLPNCNGATETARVAVPPGLDVKSYVKLMELDLYSYNDQAPTITYSIDAITALIEREGWKHWTLTVMSDSVVPAVARITDSGATGAHAATPALALCAAFCRAMAEREG